MSQVANTRNFLSMVFSMTIENIIRTHLNEADRAYSFPQSTRQSNLRAFLHLIFRLPACNQAAVEPKKLNRIRDGSPALFAVPIPGGTMLISNLALVAALSLTAIAVAQEKKIQRADLPPAVEKTVGTQSQGATIKGFSQEKENGQTYYEAEMTVGGHSKDVLIDVTGAVVEIEEKVALDSLP